MANIAIPNSFAASTVAESAKVNANFTEIATKFNTYAVQTDVSKTITAVHTFAASILFTDNLYDIGAIGANRPRDLHLAGVARIAGAIEVAQITSHADGVIVARTGASTGPEYIDLRNTTGGMVVGVEGLSPTNIVGATAYDAVLVGKTGLSISADSGLSRHARMASTGIITFEKQLIVVTGGITVTGNSTITGTLGGLTGLTVVSGGLTVTAGNVSFAAGTLTVSGAFGCNTKAAQGAYASGGALNAYASGSFGLFAEADMSALHALVVKIRAALVADGIMS